MAQQAGVRMVVVGGRPEPGPMQATSGSRGALAYSAEYLDEDIAASSGQAPDQALPVLNRDTEQRDSGMHLTTTGFNLRDQVRSQDPQGPPLQFSYDAADCRLYWTLDNALNMTRLWYDTAGAMWELGLNASCVPGSTGYASHGGSTSATAAAPQNTATQVPSLPALDRNDNVPPGYFEDVGLEDGTLPGFRPKPPGKKPIPCPAASPVTTDLGCVVVKSYVCDNGRKELVCSRQLLQRCISNAMCSSSYSCETTDDYYFESAQQSQLGEEDRRGRVPQAQGYCMPLAVQIDNCNQMYEARGHTSSAPLDTDCTIYYERLSAMA